MLHPIQFIHQFPHRNFFFLSNFWHPLADRRNWCKATGSCGGAEVHPVQTGMILGGRQGNGMPDKLCVCISAPLITPGLPGLPHRKDMGKHQRWCPLQELMLKSHKGVRRCPHNTKPKKILPQIWTSTKGYLDQGCHTFSDPVLNLPRSGITYHSFSSRISSKYLCNITVNIFWLLAQIKVKEIFCPANQDSQHRKDLAQVSVSGKRNAASPPSHPFFNFSLRN